MGFSQEALTYRDPESMIPNKDPISSHCTNPQNSDMTPVEPRGNLEIY